MKRNLFNGGESNAYKAGAAPLSSGTLLLSRQDFTASVLKRDGGHCLCCPAPATAAHHIIERVLFHDGGYYLDNGASLCDAHHMDAEMTLLEVERLRDLAGIRTVVVPAHMSPDEVLDKWGNPILKDGRRIRGELFHTEQVQKILGRAGLLDVFVRYFKYPRTAHFFGSPGGSDDDKRLKSTTALQGTRVIVSEKMDGENSTLYDDYVHARSIDGRYHPSRARIKQFHSVVRHDIPTGWRVCMENLTAVHSIRYGGLPSLFIGLSIWDDRNVCLPWDETMDYFSLMRIAPARVLYDGVFDEDLIMEISERIVEEGGEGTVTRSADAIPYAHFHELVGKYVRRGHVLTDSHWMEGDFDENGTYDWDPEEPADWSMMARTDVHGEGVVAHGR
jgi:hypothetical protein